ncbi:MAG: hypothetical protein KDC12_00750 [Flavobacteriales bacterium]|nr:hypothetical protein [Flavobacteriales bacterium]
MVQPFQQPVSFTRPSRCWYPGFGKNTFRIDEKAQQVNHAAVVMNLKTHMMKKSLLVILAAAFSYSTFAQNTQTAVNETAVHDTEKDPRSVNNSFAVTFGVPIGGVNLDGFNQGTGFGVELTNNFYVGDPMKNFRVGLNANWLQANYYRKMTDSTLTGIVEWHLLKIGPQVTVNLAPEMDVSVYANVDPIWSFGFSQGLEEGLAYSGVPLYAFGAKYRYDTLLIGVESTMGKVGFRSSEAEKPGLKDFQRFRIYFGFQF